MARAVKSIAKEHVPRSIKVWRTKNRTYFENSGPNWSKLGSLIGQLISLDMVCFICGEI